MAARSSRRAATVSGRWSCRHRKSETSAAEFGGRVSPPCAPVGSTSRVSPFAPPAGGRLPFGIRPFRYTPPSRSEPFRPRSRPFPARVGVLPPASPFARAAGGCDTSELGTGLAVRCSRRNGGPRLFEHEPYLDSHTCWQRRPRGCGRAAATRAANEDPGPSP